MITNGAALGPRGQRSSSDTTPIKQWSERSAAAVLLTPSTLRLVGGEWYYEDTTGVPGDGSLVEQNTSGDLYVKPNADVLYAGYTQHRTLVRSGMLEGYL